MNDKKTLKILQLLYAGLMADMVALFEKYGIIEAELKQRKVENALSASARIRQFKLSDPADVFELHKQLFGIAEWRIKKDSTGIEVSTSACLLKNICKSINTAEPCEVFCTMPLGSLCRALEKPYTLGVSSTLWEKEKCIFKITSTNNN